MYKISAHTMGTPFLSLEKAILLCEKIGFDGIEIIIADDYECGFKTNSSSADVIEIKNIINSLNIKVSNLVPYTKNFNSNDKLERLKSIDEFKSFIDKADILNCNNVRIWSGIDPNGTEYNEGSYEFLVESLAIIGNYLEGTSIKANVENHPYTEATSAAKTVKLVENINSPNIGILYDPGNLIYLGDTNYKEAFELQKKFINHVHLKDLTINKKSAPKNVYPVNSTTPCMFGEGIIPWEQIIKYLQNINYNKYISIEYEKRWHPKILLDPEIALPIEFKKLKLRNV